MLPCGVECHHLGKALAVQVAALYRIVNLQAVISMLNDVIIARLHAISALVDATKAVGEITIDIGNKYPIFLAISCKSGYQSFCGTLPQIIGRLKCLVDKHIDMVVALGNAPLGIVLWQLLNRHRARSVDDIVLIGIKHQCLIAVKHRTRCHILLHGNDRINLGNYFWEIVIGNRNHRFGIGKQATKHHLRMLLIKSPVNLCQSRGCLSLWKIFIHHFSRTI